MSDEWLVRAPEPELLEEIPTEEATAPSIASSAQPPASVPELRVDPSEPKATGGTPSEAKPEPLTSTPSAEAPQSEGRDSGPNDAWNAPEPIQSGPEESEPEESEPEAPERRVAHASGPCCPYCRESLHEVVEGHQDEDRAPERTVACAECRTPVHARCVQIHGACVTNGCNGRSFAFVDRVPRPQIRAARLARPRARRRAPAPREPRQIPECPRDWVRRDAPLLILGLVGILSLALFGDSLTAGARHFEELHAAATGK